MTKAEALTHLRVLTDSQAADFEDPAWDSFLAQSETVDADGVRPYEEGYVPTWDLHRAASLVWITKAGNLARTAFDLHADMTKANRSGQIDNAFKMARRHAAISRARIVGAPDPVDEDEAGDNVSPDA